MAFNDLPLFRAMREKMMFHEARQQVLSENIANAATPGYQAEDIDQPDFFRMVASSANMSEGSLRPTVTSERHISSASIGGDGEFRKKTVEGYEVTPDGNGVVLEEQMMKVTNNQMDYQMAASLYQRSLGILKTAIGRG
ncbi:putative proximal rod protein [Hartmannibacter diazotrophicus]|uniref:Flagellar basal body rod protein FlgB n=1 Tax=Hartmannibacter diazotrophicus TaxID=1482074 RepID=A0A2C9D7F1_9HYPH|nr:flagellar basal body rod protein FlgB [Hartmannibacter diazotrophicus]SON56206.1 putative proximal rod protein [Hartmannibacter diazotrophicus]